MTRTPGRKRTSAVMAAALAAAAIVVSAPGAEAKPNDGQGPGSKWNQARYDEYMVSPGGNKRFCCSQSGGMWTSDGTTKWEVPTKVNPYGKTA